MSQDVKFVKSRGAEFCESISRRMDQSVLERVLIPDLLVLVAKYLGEDTVAIRFVCKQSDASLRTVPSGIHMKTLTQLERSELDTLKECYSFEEFSSLSRDRDNKNKAKPYVTSLSRLTWAVNVLEMPLNISIYYAAIESGHFTVVAYGCEAIR